MYWTRHSVFLQAGAVKIDGIDDPRLELFFGTSAKASMCWIDEPRKTFHWKSDWQMEAWTPHLKWHGCWCLIKHNGHVNPFYFLKVIVIVRFPGLYITLQSLWQIVSSWFPLEWPRWKTWNSPSCGGTWQSSLRIFELCTLFGNFGNIWKVMPRLEGDKSAVPETPKELACQEPILFAISARENIEFGVEVGAYDSSSKPFRRCVRFISLVKLFWGDKSGKAGGSGKACELFGSPKPLQLLVNKSFVPGGSTLPCSFAFGWNLKSYTGIWLWVKPKIPL